MSTIQKNNTTSSPKYQNYNEMFDHIFAGIQTDQLMLATGVAPQFKHQMYASMFNNDVYAVSAQVRSLTDGVLIKKMLIEYTKNLMERNAFPLRLAFTFSQSKIYFWAMIKDDDEDNEDALITTEAYINSRFYDLGLNVSTTIIEESDKMPVPKHYIDIPIKEVEGLS